MEFETIRLRVEGRVAVLTLNRPKVLNAFNRDLMREVTQAMKACVESPSVLAIVVHGEGRAFSAGFDMKASSGAANRDGEEWRRVLREDLDFIIQFWDCPKPTVAAVHGYCLAGAFELALACDMTIAAEGTRFGEPEVRFGASIVCLLLPWMTTPKLAKELLLTGNDRIDASRAHAMGIVNDVVPAGTELERAMRVANDLCAASPAAVRITKEAINRSYATMGMRDALLAAVDAAVVNEMTGGAARTEFNRLLREQGLKAALAWRDSRFSASA